MTPTTEGQGAACGPGDEQFDRRYRAIDGRDARFDGQFFTAVSSTGIYCRPSCPARTPKPENVSFYLTSAAAHTAGYRACKRCLPEASPGTPEWNLRGDVAGRAMRLIADGLVDRDGVDGLAARLGYTGRHLRRLLTDELGVGPVALARARRAQSARALLVGTDLPITDVAFAAGFGSVRQFNATVRDVFDASPGEIRALRHAGPGGHSTLSADAAVVLDLPLPVRQPFDAPEIFSFLATRAVVGIEVAEITASRLRYARTLGLPGGPGAVDIVATPAAGSGWEVSLRLEVTTLTDVVPAVTRVRRLLDLDADPVAVDEALSADPHMATLVKSAPGIRVPGAVDPHELLVRAIVGQQISVARATGHLDRLVNAAGERWVSSIPGLDRLFPTPARIIHHVPAPVDGAPFDPDRPLRLPRRSVRAVIACSKALVAGELDLHVGADPLALREQLVAMPGIGPWTAAYVAMRVLGDPDAWLPGDVALVAGARSLEMLPAGLSKPEAHRALAERSRDWAPWRSHAVMHLWRAAGAPEHTEGV
ncbi:MAG: Ada metal-binding domain-containing protein [Propionibacteriaceae bacterium]|nr:Ada metal-binding domain-containing protein [Propionibacteriaceae bacterium]